MKEWGFSWAVRVYYEDTDAAGLVYHGNYPRYLERARTEWLRHIGFSQPRLREEQGIMFVVRRMNIEYLQSARFDDLISVRASLARCSGARLVFDHEIVAADDTRLCRARVEVACVDTGTLRPRRLPAQLIKELDGVH